MEFNLYTLARARALFDAGASVDEAYRALADSPHPQPQHAGYNRNQNDQTAITAATARRAYLDALENRLWQPPEPSAEGQAEPEAADDAEPPAPPVSETPPEPEHTQAAAGTPSPSHETPETVTPDAPPQASPPVSGLRDQIAAAVTRISMLKGEEPWQGTGAGPSAPRGG